jgi:hypothetical protein
VALGYLPTRVLRFSLTASEWNARRHVLISLCVPSATAIISNNDLHEARPVALSYQGPFIGRLGLPETSARTGSRTRQNERYCESARRRPSHSVSHRRLVFATLGCSSCLPLRARRSGRGRHAGWMATCRLTLDLPSAGQPPSPRPLSDHRTVKISLSPMPLLISPSSI